MRVPFFLSLAFLVPLLLKAQGGEDVRISPVETPYYDLPAAYRIESADRIGDITLAVWGTARSLDRSSVVGELRYQLVSGSALADSQKILTDTAARPFDFVQVIPGHAFFLVVWRDARADAPGLYAQRVGKEGNLLGKPVRIGPGYVRRIPGAQNMMVFGGKDRLIVWLDGRPDSAGLYALRLSENGAFAFPGTKIADDLRSSVRFESLPGLSFLRTSDTQALMIYPDGRIDRRAIRWPRDGVAYNVAGDTSLVTLDGPRLDYFSSIFDTAPSWSATVPALDSAVAGGRMLTRNSAGVPEIYFVAVEITGAMPDYGIFRISGYRLPVFGPDSSGTPESDYEWEGFNGMISSLSLTGSFVDMTGSAYRQGCGNTGLITLDFRTVPYIHGNPQPSKNSRRFFSMNGAGDVFADSSGYTAFCPQSTALPARIRFDTFSVVRVAVVDTVVDLSAPIAPREIPHRQFSPSLVPDQEGGLLCIWGDEKWGLAQSRVTLPFSGFATDVRYLAVPQLSTQTSSSGSRIQVQECSYAYKNDTYYRSPEFAGLCRNHRTRCRVLEYITQASYQYYYVFTHQAQLYLPGAQGWKAVYRSATSSSTKGYRSDLHWVEASIIGYDQWRKEMLAGIEQIDTVPGGGPRHQPLFTLNAMDAMGNIRWKVDSLPLPMTGILPADSLHYLRITDTSAAFYKERTVLSAYPLPRSRGAVSCQRLAGTRFLRRWQPDSAGVHLAIYDFYGNPVAETDYPLPPSFAGAWMVQRPGDSALVFLWANGKSVHAAIFDKNLNVVAADTLIGARQGRALSPTGIFVGDTLYAVWDDLRNGNVDIYGTGILLPSIPATSSVAAEERADVLPARVVPNPAGDVLRIEFGAATALPTELELIDPRGVVVGRQTLPAGGMTATLSTREYASGPYRLRWRRDGGVESLPVLIVH